MDDMRPEHLGETLSAYLDGELDAETAARVEQWLRDDRSARDQLAVLRRTVDLVSALPRHRAPDTLSDDLQAQLERAALMQGFAEPKDSTQPRRRPLLAVLSTAAVFAFVAGGMWFMALDTPGAGPMGGSAFPAAEMESTRNESLADAGAAKERRLARRARSGNRETRGASSELLASATLEQKLAVGLDIESVRTHAFANEPIRLHLKSTDARAERSVASRLLSRLAKIGLLDAAAAAPARSVDNSRIAGLFYRGAAHQNFGETGGTQILVRASPQQLDEMLLEISRESKAVSSVKLSSGPLVVRGLPRVRGALATLGTGGEFAGDPLGALANVLGMDRIDSAPRPSEFVEPPTRIASTRARRSGKRKTGTASVSRSAASSPTDAMAESYVTLVIEITPPQASSAPSTRREAAPRARPAHDESR